MQPTASSTPRTPDSTIVVFALDGHAYGIPARDAREVIAWTQPRPLPGSPPWITGVINLRGQIIPVCDLARALDLRPPADTTEQKILIVEAGDEREWLGLAVDEVRAVVVHDVADRVEASGFDHPAMTGIVRCNGDLVVLLDAHAVLATDDAAGRASLALAHSDDQHDIGPPTADGDTIERNAA